MASPGHAKPSIKKHGHLKLSNVSSPIWCQVIILTNDDFLFIGHLVAKFSEQHDEDQHCLGNPGHTGHQLFLPIKLWESHRVILCPFAGGFNVTRCHCIHNIPIRINMINSSWTSLHVSKQPSNGSWCMGIKGEMSGTVCVTFTWYMYIYQLFIAFVCFVVCSFL